MRPTDLVLTEEARKGFWPTPSKLAGMMLSGIDWRYVNSVLEPSAGKGDLVDALARALHSRYGHWRSTMDVDCVEVDPHLRQILRYEWSEERREELRRSQDTLEHIPYDQRSEDQAQELARIGREIWARQSVALHVVHDDFLTYHTYKRYGLCLMNPPFDHGDLHLLRAIEIMRHGGKIVCLLNASTLRDPYTLTRRLLARKLEELDASIQYVEDAFRDAERRTDVEVAIVRVTIPAPTYRSTIYDRLKKAADRELDRDPELHELVTADYLEQAVRMYQVEVEATLELVREYHALCPYMAQDLTPDDRFGTGPILTLVVGHGNTYGGFDYGAYMREVRLKYWRALMRNPKFTGKLTSALQEQYRSEVEKLADYEFSMFNIQQVRWEMQEKMSVGIDETIMALFDKLTAEHSWYPECTKNVHYYNGWKTNKAHMIGQKCIIPIDLFAREYHFDGRGETQEFDKSKAYAAISDLEKTLDYLSARPVGDYDLSERLAKIQPGTAVRNVVLRYFTLDAYKKGTIHIKFLPEAMPVVERLNIYAARKRGWLPPNYGKVSYTQMDEEERAVVDSFHGDGGAGSGESAYAEVLREASYYLAEPAQRLPALMAPEAS